jgi:hypothetical protein
MPKNETFEKKKVETMLENLKINPIRSEKKRTSLEKLYNKFLYLAQKMEKNEKPKKRR